MMFLGTRLSFWLPFLVGVGVLVSWEGVVRAGMVSPLVLVAPSAIAGAIWLNMGELSYHAAITLTQALIGFVLGNLMGLLVAISFLAFSPFKRAFFPIFVLAEAIPFVAILPVLILWMGNGMAPKVFIAGFLSFFPMLVNAYRGLSNTDAEVLELMHSFSASPWQVLRKVRLPAAMPFIFTALKLGACGAVIASLVAEWLASQQGLGFLIVSHGVAYRTAEVWAAAIVACAMSLTLYGLVAKAESLGLRRRGGADKA